MNYIKKHTAISLGILLFIICIALFCINISGYPFLDWKETKFVSMANEMLNNNDWLNIRLNGNIVKNTFPLIFWIINISCIIFGKVSTISMRLPIAIISCISIVVIYCTLRTILTNTYSFIISLIISTSLGILIFSRLATNDILFVYSTMTIILLSYHTIFSKNEKIQFWLWMGIYLFSAISALLGGLFGVFIPLISIIAMNIFVGNLKQIFNPKYIIPGSLLFCIVFLPWNLIMIHQYGFDFLKESLKIYNFFNYIGIKEIFIVLGLFILGFSPWTFSFIWLLGTRFRGICNSFMSYFKDNSQDKLKEKWKKLNKIEKFISLNTIVFFTALIFAILYGYKYNFLILFLILPASCVSGHYWYEYIIKNKHDKSIFFATIIPDIILIVCSLVALFGHDLLNTINTQGFNHIIIPLIIILFIIPVIAIFAVILKGRIIAFCSNIILMISISFMLITGVFNLISQNTGENDLIKFSQEARTKNTELTAFISSIKYSIPYYYDKPIKFYINKDTNYLKNYLYSHQEEYVIVEIKDLWQIEDNEIKYKLIDTGTRYCMIQYLKFSEQLKQEKAEKEIKLY